MRRPVPRPRALLAPRCNLPSGWIAGSTTAEDEHIRTPGFGALVAPKRGRVGSIDRGAAMAWHDATAGRRVCGVGSRGAGGWAAASSLPAPRGGGRAHVRS